MDCLRDVQNILKRTEASTCCQILASYITNFSTFRLFFYRCLRRCEAGDGHTEG